VLDMMQVLKIAVPNVDEHEARALLSAAVRAVMPGASIYRAWVENVEAADDGRPTVEVRESFELKPGAQPATRAEALLLAHAWGSTLSHQNVIMGLERIDEHGPRRGETLTWVARADAAEVERLAALAQMLPERVPEDPR
jgi:hypothetical protein